MPKGQLSRVPWPGNSWRPFTFQPALWALQQPHEHSHSLQLLHTLNSLSLNSTFLNGMGLRLGNGIYPMYPCFFASPRGEVWQGIPRSFLRKSFRFLCTIVIVSVWNAPFWLWGLWADILYSTLQEWYQSEVLLWDAYEIHSIPNSLFNGKPLMNCHVKNFKWLL